MNRTFRRASLIVGAGGKTLLSGVVSCRVVNGPIVCGFAWVAICLLSLMVPVAAARGQSSRSSGDEQETVESAQKFMSRIMADYDRRQRHDEEEHARQVAEYDREVAQQRQSEIDAQAKQASLQIVLLVFLAVVSAFWVVLVLASARRQKATHQRALRMIELLESIDRRLPGPPATPPSPPRAG
jgi:ABC-type transport system involved in cytochrome bd biosynthesis fused ATPase/permease subunit